MQAKERMDRQLLDAQALVGHLVPAGTGFHMHQDSEVRISPEALEAMGVRPPVAPTAAPLQPVETAAE